MSVYLVQDYITIGCILVHIFPLFFFLVMFRLLKNVIAVIALRLEEMSADYIIFRSLR
jgi:hypothetical protein